MRTLFVKCCVTDRRLRGATFIKTALLLWMLSLLWVLFLTVKELMHASFIRDFSPTPPALFHDINNVSKEDESLTTKLRYATPNVLSECEIRVNTSTSLAQRFPHFIIIGFGKAGTRAVYQMIRLHPDVEGSRNEIRFFSNDENYKKGLEYYIGQIPATDTRQKTIVKSPDYIIKPKAVVRLKEAIERCRRTTEIKFIVVLRDPFDRAVSEYLLHRAQTFSTKQKVVPPFELMCVKRTGEINNLNAQVNASIYSYHLENWLKHYKLSQICFVDGYALVKKPYLEIKKLEQCLGLRDFIKEQHFYFNKARGYFCPVDTSGNPKCLARAKGVAHPKINEDVERKLKQFFRPFNQRLYKIIGVDYGWT